MRTVGIYWLPAFSYLENEENNNSRLNNKRACSPSFEFEEGCDTPALKPFTIAAVPHQGAGIDPVNKEAACPIRGRHIIARTATKMLEAGTLDVRRTLANLRVWDAYYGHVKADVSCGLRWILSKLIRHDPYEAQAMVVPSSHAHYDEQLRFLHTLAQQDGIYSKVMVDEDGITTQCSRQFRGLFFSSDDFHQKLYDLNQDCFYIWGSMISPEDQPAYYEEISKLMFSKDLETEATLVVKCTNRHGERMTCLWRLRRIQDLSGKAGASILSLVPLQSASYFQSIAQQAHHTNNNNNIKKRRMEIDHLIPLDPLQRAHTMPMAPSTPPVLPLQQAFSLDYHMSHHHHHKKPSHFPHITVATSPDEKEEEGKHHDQPEGPHHPPFWVRESSMKEQLDLLYDLLEDGAGDEEHGE